MPRRKWKAYLDLCQPPPPKKKKRGKAKRSGSGSVAEPEGYIPFDVWLAQIETEEAREKTGEG